ncbi:HAD family hydrolase [Ammoniphilus sp. 3BR4]|uniref:HAD family hydrolase n=1 Tax=Ammoniphilus sp. 3BR4 TaxID=3158265 RepID=UPI003466C072
MREIEVIIFDLDGTLYQDHDFYKRYLGHLLRESEKEEELDNVIAEAKRILQHAHPFKLGHLYHHRHEIAFHVVKDNIQSAQTWDGQEADLKKLIHLANTDPNFWNDCLYAGDAWGVVAILSRRLNLSDGRLREAFEKVRKDMISSENGIMRDDQLMMAINELTRVQRKILITNTDHYNGVECVSYLGIDALFDQVFYDGKKPHGIASRMKSILEETGLQPNQVLSIGDNPWNDLYPVKKLGGRTVWISPYESMEQEAWDSRLRTINELTGLLRELQKNKEWEIVK